MKMKYLEPEMSIILFDDGVYTDNFLIGNSTGGNDGDGDIGEDDLMPAYLE